MRSRSSVRQHYTLQSSSSTALHARCFTSLSFTPSCPPFSSLALRRPVLLTLLFLSFCDLSPTNVQRSKFAPTSSSLTRFLEHSTSYAKQFNSLSQAVTATTISRYQQLLNHSSRSQLSAQLTQASSTRLPPNSTRKHSTIESLPYATSAVTLEVEWRS